MVNVIEPQFNLHSEEGKVSNHMRENVHSTALPVLVRGNIVNQPNWRCYCFGCKEFVYSLIHLTLMDTRVAFCWLPLVVVL